MTRWRNGARGAACAVLVLLGASSAPALAAGGEGEVAISPTLVAIPYHAVFEATMAEGWLVEDCGSLVAPKDVIFTCEPKGMTFAVEEYDPMYVPQQFPVMIVNGSQRLLVNYVVSQAPPEPPVPGALDYAFPFAAGTHVLLPYSDLGIVCQGCGSAGPVVEILGVEPAIAGTARATPTHLELLPVPGYVGAFTVGYVAHDPFGQESVVGTVAVSFYASGKHSLTALHVVIAADHGPLDLNELVLSSDATAKLHFLDCGPTLYGTVACADGVAKYAPADEWPGIDQFSFHVFSDNGEQATGSVTIVDSARVAELPLGLVLSRVVDKNGTIVPSLPVAEKEAVATSGVFAPLQQVLDRVTGRTKGDQQMTGEEST